jgi:hypothetical protein
LNLDRISVYMLEQSYSARYGVTLMAVTLTQLLAVYGAALSSIALGWNLYRDLVDRGKLRVSAPIQRLVVSEDGKTYGVKHDLRVHGASEKVFIVVSAVNVGRRPMMIKGLGGSYREAQNGKHKFAIIPRGMPRMLQEGEYHTELTDELFPNLDNVKSLFMWDTTKREWKVPNRELKKLKQEAHTVLKESTDSHSK